MTKDPGSSPTLLNTSSSAKSSDGPTVIPTRSITPAQIDADALKVVRRLQRFGHAAYLVGGCVRDLLLKRTPKDFDVVTSARPPEVRKLFRNCRLIGRRFRLAHIHFRGKIIETATFRAAAGPQQDGDLLIRSDNVFGSEAEDALRRDFTINALFYDPVERTLVDYVGGLEDLVERRLRFIGDPAIRVQEDPVRILRAVKFAARLQFEVDPATWRAAMDFRQELNRAAPPRLLEEILRMLRGGSAEAAYRLLWTSGVLETLLPEVAHYVDRSAQRGEEDDPGATLWAYLRALDRSDRELMTNPVLLATLLVHPVWDAVQADPACYGLEPSSTATGEVARSLLIQVVERLRLPKREASRIQQLMVASKRLFGLRRNQPLPKALMRRSYFPEALDLFELGVRATRRGRRVLSGLRHAYAKPKPPSKEAGDSPFKSKRSHRRERPTGDKPQASPSKSTRKRSRRSTRRRRRSPDKKS